MNGIDAVYGCRGKHGYDSYNGAKNSIRIMREKLHERRLEAYHCGKCHKWHIGAVPRIQKKASRRDLCYDEV